MNDHRLWGKAPNSVAVVHGGPGAPGYMAAIARELEKDLGVLEPLQTKNSIKGQITELSEILKKHAETPVILVGHSWGATLSYLTAARCADLVKKIILIGLPPLDPKKRPDLTRIWMERLTEKERVEFTSLEDIVWDGTVEEKNESMGKLFRLITKADSYDMLPSKDEVLQYQVNMNIFIYRDLAKLQQTMDMTKLIGQIPCPIVAIHGEDDFRPAELAKETLSPAMGGFKLHLLKKCGHYPWLERYARDDFFKILREELGI